MSVGPAPSGPPTAPPEGGAGRPSSSPSPEPTFTWEVYRHFYPEPRWPKHPTRVRRTQMTALLLVAGVLLLSLASLYTLAGVAGDVGGYSIQVHGKVSGNGAPLDQVQVQLSGAPSGPSNTVYTNGSGYFTFAGVGQGSHVLRFTALGYALTTVTLFISAYLEYPSANLTDLSVQMVPGNSTDLRALNYSPFSDMEDYLASVFSTTVVEAVGGLVALWGAMGLARRDRPPRAVVGGAGALLAPFFPLTLGTGALYYLFFPPAVLLMGAAGGLGLVVVVLTLWSYRPFLAGDA